MDLKLFMFGEYGQFIWAAFVFTFIICVYLYIRTAKELQKQEKLFFNEFRRSQAVKIKVTKKKETTKKTLSNSSISAV